MKESFWTQKLSPEQVIKLSKFSLSKWKLVKITWFTGWRIAIPLYLFGALVACDLLFWNWNTWLRFTVITIWSFLTLMTTIFLSLIVLAAQQEAKKLYPHSDE